jgi:hypothetical protein
MSTSLPQTQSPANGNTGDIDHVYQQLVKGVGRELVTDANAEELARRAEQDGHTILATELREWQAPC